MKPAWTIRTEYRKLRLPLDFYLPLSVGWSEYRETSVCEKKYTEPELAALSVAFQKETEEKLIEKGVHIMASDGKLYCPPPRSRLEVIPHHLAQPWQ